MGVTVELWRNTPPGLYESKWVENGVYRFEGLPNSIWTVKIISPKDPDYWEDVLPQEVEINDMERVHVVDFIMTRAHQTYQLFLSFFSGP